MSSFRLIDAERANHPVATLCRMLGVSKKCGYYSWSPGRPPGVVAARTRPSRRRSARSMAGAARPTALLEGARRAAFARVSVRPAQGGEADAQSRNPRLRARQKEEDLSP